MSTGLSTSYGKFQLNFFFKFQFKRWRGDQMLPINDRKYQQWPNHTLIIQRVEEKDSGYYTCHVCE